jgi:hypothetical protein
MRAIHNDKRGEFIASELVILTHHMKNKLNKNLKEDFANEINNSDKIDINAAKRVARETLNNKKIKDVNSLNKYLSAEYRANNKVQIALAKGDYFKAIEYKRQALFNHYLFSEGVKLKEKIDIGLRYLAKFNKNETRKKLGKVGGGYLEQIEGILERYDLRRSITLKKIKERKSLLEWVKKQEAIGNDVVISDKLLNEANKNHYKDMNIDEFFGMKDTIKNIEHLANLKGKLLANEKQKSFDEVKKGVLDAIKNNGITAKKRKEFNRKWHDKAKDLIGEFDMHHRKIEFIADKLDGHEGAGKVWNAIFKPLVDAEYNSEIIKTSFDKKANTLLGGHKMNGKYRIYSMDETLSKKDIVAMALNYGNEGNKKALIDGHGLTDENIEEIFTHMTKEDWNYVQNMWNLIDELWEPIKTLEKEITGLTPERVEATPIKTKYGTFAGGYYPISYDVKNSLGNITDQTVELFGRNIGSKKPTKVDTKHGFTQERVGSGGKKLDLNIGVAGGHIKSVIHDLTHRKAIIDINQILSDRDIANSIVDSVGMNSYRVLQETILYIAQNGNKVDSGWRLLADKVAKISIMTIGAKISTVTSQVAGFIQTGHMIGWGRTLKGAAKGLDFVFKNGFTGVESSINFAMQNSKVLPFRRRTFDQTVADILNDNKFNKLSSDMKHALFYPMGMADMFVSVPTWIGAYDKGMKDFRGDEARAFDYADSVIRMSQGAGGLKDLSSVQRNIIMKMVTMFYSFYNVYKNTIARNNSIIKKRGGFWKNPVRNFASYLDLFVLEAIVGMITAGMLWDPEEEEAWEWAYKGILSHSLGGYVGIRDIANATLNGFGYEGTPLISTIDTIINTGRIIPKLFTGEELTKGNIKGLAKTGAFFSPIPIPVNQLMITTEGLIDLINDDDFTPASLLYYKNRSNKSYSY